MRDTLSKRTPTPRSWISRLPEAQQQELLAIKDEWKSGQYGASCPQTARAIMAHCRERGIQTCGISGMVKWLADRV